MVDVFIPTAPSDPVKKGLFMTDSKDFDIIVYGATSFVGEIIVGYLMKQYGASGDIKWAVAGRSETKLSAVKKQHDAEAIPHIIADATDEAALRDMATKTKVILSTVGPYALYGEPLVKVCAETGTDYCDLTGEVQWYKRMVDKYESAAKLSGARIIHCSGFDSIPSDMGNFFLQQKAHDAFGEFCSQVDMRVARIKGSASGGTVASLMNITKEAAKDPALRRELKNPYSICPEGHGFTVRQNDASSSAYDPVFDAWTAPFVMAAVNTRVVHRSNALMNAAWGKKFKYSEAMLTGGGSKGKSRARKMSFGLKAFVTLAAMRPSRWILEKFILPKPGEGPSPKAQEEGMYDMRFIGQTVSGKRIKVKVTGDRDPGYGSTAKMISEAAICLSTLPKESKDGGFWTPSTAFGNILIDRLTTNAGLTFEVLED